MKPTKGVKMALVGRFGILVIRMIAWTVVYLFVWFAASQIWMKLYKTFQTINYGSLKTTILRPVVALKK